ncbi:MAG: BrnT family toxin [Thermomicrobiales bacterium]
MGCLGCDRDPRKNIENQRKHGISFDDACCIFEDPCRIEEIDDGDYDEDRWVVVGRVGNPVLVVVYTDRNRIERIISARPTTRKEELEYYAHNAEHVLG